MTLNGSWSPYISPTAGSPPNGYPTTMAFQGSNSYSNGDGVVSFAPPPGGLSPTTDSPPANSSYTQVKEGQTISVGGSELPVIALQCDSNNLHTLIDITR